MASGADGSDHSPKPLTLPAATWKRYCRWYVSRGTSPTSSSNSKNTPAGSPSTRTCTRYPVMRPASAPALSTGAFQRIIAVDASTTRAIGAEGRPGSDGAATTHADTSDQGESPKALRTATAK